MQVRKVEATVDNLNAVMEFEHVIRVHEDGTVTEGYDLMAPDLTAEVDADGQCIHGDEELIRQANSYRDSWELLGGFTGQYGYNGVVLHPSEFIGGGLARHILETPGYYVAVTVECQGPDNDPDENENPYEPAGWAVAFKETE